MKHLELIKRNDVDALGKFYLTLGFKAFLAKRVEQGGAFISLGLQTLTCDCGDWLKQFDHSIIPPWTAKKGLGNYLFCKAVFLSYRDDPKDLSDALEAVDQCIKMVTRQSAQLYYIQAKITSKLGHDETARCIYQFSYYLLPYPITLYRLGRLKEETLGESGVHNFYYAFLQNPTSPCCGRVLLVHSRKRGIIPPIVNSTKEDNLTTNFINLDPYVFQHYFEKLLNNYSPETVKQIVDFTEYLRNNEISFTQDVENDDFNFDPQEDEGDRFHQDDWKELNFNAMTDGQLGSYGDFLENGGDSDWADDWSGR